MQHSQTPMNDRPNGDVPSGSFGSNNPREIRKMKRDGKRSESRTERRIDGSVSAQHASVQRQSAAIPSNRASSASSRAYASSAENASTAAKSNSVSRGSVRGSRRASGGAQAPVRRSSDRASAYGAMGSDSSRVPLSIQSGTEKRPSKSRSHKTQNPSSLSRVGVHAPSKKASGMRHAKAATLAEAVQSKSKRRMFIIGLAVVILALAAAALVGVYTFFRTTNANLDLGSSNAREALVAAEEGDPFFVLCSADLSIEHRKTQPDELQGFMLVRVDENARNITFVTIPEDLSVRLDDGSLTTLDALKRAGDDAVLINALSTLLSVKINHYVETDASHIAGMVDLIGGIDMDVTEEIDDPYVSTKVIKAGQQRLSGEDALLYLRATNISGGFDKTAANRVDFTLDLIDQALSNEGFNFAAAVSDASNYIDTDLSASDLLSLGEKSRPFSEMTKYSCIIPTYNSLDSESDSLSMNLYRDKWRPMLEKIENNEDPALASGVIADMQPDQVSVEVRNGTLMNGVGARLGEILQQFGYNVVGVGNVDDGTIYPETLVVYTDGAYEGAAVKIVDDMGCGRVVNGGDFYSSEASVIVIIGLDYIPPM